jgi:hypothetical protein
VIPTRGESFDVRDGVAAIAVEPDSAVVTIPDAHFLFTADFKRKGPDLVLTGEDGRKMFVPDYFRHEKHLDLRSPEGALLSAEMVDLLSAGPTQYAQDGPPAGQQPIGRVENINGAATAVRNGGATWLMGTVSFVESSFFPIPHDRHVGRRWILLAKLQPSSPATAGR